MDPIEMPSPLPINSKEFELQRYESLSPSGGGFLQTIERNRPLWYANYTSPPLNDVREQAMRTFLDNLEGASNTFVAYDPRRPMPYAYRGAPLVTPWGSDPLVLSGVYSTSQLTIQADTGLQLTNGDYIQISIGNAVWLFRSKQAETVGGSGTGTINLLVTPRPPDFSDAGHPIRFAKAGAEMKMVPGSLKWTDSVGTLPQVAFSAIQYVERGS